MPCARLSPNRDSAGYSLLEVIVVLAIIGILLAISAANISKSFNSSQSAAETLMSFLKTARVKAVASTSAYLVQAISDTEAITRSTNSCPNDCSAAVGTIDTKLSMTFEDGAVMNQDDWCVCFNSRGLAQGNVEVTVLDIDNQYRTIEVLLGGAVQPYEP